MRSYRRILVATDFSDAARQALDEAHSLASLIGASLTVAHVYAVPAFTRPKEFEPNIDWLRSLEAAARRDLAELQRSYGGAFAVEAIYGTVDSLLRFATEHDNDLIVVGTHGQSAMSRLLLGSFAERVVRRSPLPVLSIRQRPAEGASYRRILVATDFSDGARRALDEGLALGRHLGASITVAHAYAHPFAPGLRRIPPNVAWLSEMADAVREELDAIQDTCRREHIEVGAVAVLGNADALLEYAMKANVGLIVVGTRGHSTFERMFVGSFAERILRHSRIPVLSVRDPREAS